MRDNENKILMNDVHAIKQEVTNLGLKVDKMYMALMGSDITNDGGLVGRIQILETESEALSKKIEEINAKSAKSDLHIKIIWGLVGAFGSGIFTYVLALLSKK